MLKPVAKIFFDADIVREYSARATADQLGKAKCTMELRLNDERTRGEIEWVVEYYKPAKDRLGFPYEEDVEYIGLTFENGELVDYDGLMSLPLEAAQFLIDQGFKVNMADFDL